MMTMKNLIQSLPFLITVLMSAYGAEEVIYAQVGERVILPIPKVDLQKYYVSWWFEGQNDQLAWRNPLGGKKIESKDEKWIKRLDISGNQLVINDIQQEFFGAFSCKLSLNNQHSTVIYQVIQVNVNVKPASLLLTGDILSLTCNLGKIPQGQTKPSIYWLNPQETKAGNNQVTVNVQAKSEHNGQWFCVVKDKNEKKFPVSVAVVGLVPVPLKQYTSTDLSLTIPCSINSGITWEQIKKMGIEEVQWHFVPKLSSSPISANKRLFNLSLERMTWEKTQETGLSPVSSLKKGNLSLTRSKAKAEDSGRYTCSMTFKNGRTLNSTVDVDVLQIISHPGTELYFGQQLNLSCNTADQLPTDGKLKWIPPETSLLPTSVHHHAHITIQEVGKGDNGKWRCELWQGKNQLTSAEILLKIEPRLSVWMLVIISSAAFILLLLLVLAFIHYRRRQQRMRLLRHRLCQCKNPKPKGFYRT